MSNTNLQTQTSNALHNAIVEAGGKDRPPMLASGSSETTTEVYMENYKNVSQDIRDQPNAEAEAVQIILTWIDDDIYSIVDACSNACEIWKAIERSQQAATITRGKAIVNSSPATYDQEPTMVTEDDEKSKDKEIDKLMALISLSFKKIYKPTNNNLVTSSNTSRANQDNTSRINRGNGYDNQRVVNVAGARENVGTQVQNNDDNYNVFAIESEHLEQPESVNDTYPVEQDEHDIIINSLDMSYDREQDDQDDNDDLAKERDLLASLIEKQKYKIDDSKNRNKFLKTSNKALVDKLKDKEIEKVIVLENKVKALDDIVYKTGQSVQTMNMLNRNCKTSFVKPEFLKKAQRANPRLTKMPMGMPISTREPKQTMNQSVATPLRRIVALESPNQKPRSTIRKLYEHVSKTCSWWYPKFTPSGYKWKPKSLIVNVNTNVSIPLGNESRTANILEPMTPSCHTLSNTLLSSNSFVALRDNSIHRRLWVLKAHDGTSQASKVYYVEGLNHNLFSVGQLCDADLEVAFQNFTCYIRDLTGKDLLTESINGKKYLLEIVDDYSRYTWTHFLRSKDETPKVLINFLKLVQRGLHAQVRTVRTDKDT
nr:integrase, catalytic region, zinc finger, CCHC-type, peptidase aspartic, catalytic [Tanacetum cinerariifolium]